MPVRKRVLDQPGFSWKELGPSNVAGRVISVAFHPTDPLTFYAGSAGGGLYRTTNGGTSWTQLGGDRLPSLWIGAVAIDPGDPNTIYAGTGEAVFGAANDPGANLYGYGGFGGILKSTDGGLTFSQINLQAYGFFQILISPVDSADIIATSEGAIYRSLDGGASWTSTSPGASPFSVDRDPFDPKTLLAVVGDLGGGPNNGLIRSTDGGSTWVRLGNPSPDVFADQTGRSAVAFAPSVHGLVYLALGPKVGDDNGSSGFFKSADGGATWTRMDAATNTYRPVDWYGASLAIDPTDGDHILQNNAVGPGVILESRDGGSSWRHADGDWHVDAHAVAFHPLNPRYAISGTDGGVAVSTDGGISFFAKNEGFPTVQFYSVAVVPGSPDTAYGGTQDNRMVAQRTNQGATFDRVSETFSYIGDIAGIVAGSNRVVATSATAYGVGVSVDGGHTWTKSNGFLPGDSGPWDAAIVADPEDPLAVYCGTTRVNRSLDGGSTWTPFDVRSYGPADYREKITSIAVSPVDSNRVYALTDQGKAFRSIDRGVSWSDISAGLPTRYGTRVAGGPGSADLVYASFGGTGGGHVFRSTDGGATWTDISGDLPDISVNAIVADPRHPFWLWAATDAGIAWTYDDGSTWEKVEEGLPRAVFLDLSLDPTTGRLVAASYGRGLWELEGSANLAHALNGRFEIQVTWSVPAQNKSGVGIPVSLTSDTSGFWFFDSSNIELVVKVLDGRPVNGNFWVFYGALSNVQYTITVFDTVTRVTKTYTNPSGQLASVADTSAFPPTTSGAAALSSTPSELGTTSILATRSAEAVDAKRELLEQARIADTTQAAPCASDGATLCLNGGRFEVKVDWAVPSKGTSGHGTPVPIAGDTGYMWFFNSTNVELIIKVLDGRPVNGHFWVFYGALSDVQYAITVRDTQTGAVKSYTNPDGKLASVADTEAF